ncbi:MAG: transporter substrate-binding domain-containing protein [Deltaproteobacteria bacterium]|nr:transporter substrate-binding domain-containing protein [Deltaproteobacteria bacterium]
MRFLLLAVTVLVWWFPVLASATSLDEIRVRGVLRVGMSGDYAPFCVCTESAQECSGFEVEMARRLAADLAVRFDIVRFRWPELRHDVMAEKFDLAMSGVTMRPERLLWSTFTHPYAVSGAMVLVADTSRFPSVAAVDQAGVRLAVNAGGHLEQVARSRFGSATILATAKNMELPTLVEHKQADALLTDSFEAPQFLARYSRLSALPAFGRDRKAYLVRRTDGPWREWLDHWLADREHDGFLPGLRQRWLREERARPLSPLSAVFAFLDLRLALMPAIADYKQRYNLPVEDLRQEGLVIAHAASLARERGANADATRELFRRQIDVAKQVQEAMLKNPHRIPVWARGLDLAADLRPALSDIGDRTVELFGSHARLAVDHDAVLRAAEEEITTEGVDAEERRRLGEAVWKVLSKPMPE